MTTFTKPDGSVRKSIYHSNLIQLSGGAGTLMMVTGDPVESKYPKPDTSHVAFVKFPDDETEYSLAVENPTLEAFMAVPKNVWVFAKPSGSRDVPAGIEFSEAEGSPVYAPDPTTAAPAPMTGPPPMWPDQERAQVPPKTLTDLDPVTVACEQTIRAVRALNNAGIGIVDPTPIYSTHYIKASR